MLWTRFRDPFDDDGSPLGISRDDLIRLVVGMQWREAIAVLFMACAGVPEMRPAVDIVDEWLGVR